MAVRMPMMATTIISSMSVKPRWLPCIVLRQMLNISVSSSFGFGGGCQGRPSLPWHRVSHGRVRLRNANCRAVARRRDRERPIADGRVRVGAPGGGRVRDRVDERAGGDAADDRGDREVGQ